MSQMELIKYSIRKYILIIFKIYNHLANKKINDMKIDIFHFFPFCHLAKKIIVVRSNCYILSLFT